MDDTDDLFPTQARRLARIVEQAAYDGQYLPSGSQDRADCKVLVKQGRLEPNGRLGYRIAGNASRDAG